MYRNITIIGGAGVSRKSKDYQIALQVGSALNPSNHVLICGGMTGIMEAAARGAKKSGVLTIGILPETQKTDANKFIDIALTTGLRITRDTLVSVTADLVISIAGSLGTLNEAAICLKVKKDLIIVRDAKNGKLFYNALNKLCNENQKMLIKYMKVKEVVNFLKKYGH